jgi:hypothetical protein
MTSSRWLESFLVASVLAVTPVAAGCVGDASGDEQDLTSSAGTFETFKGSDGKYYFHLLAGNYEKVLQSQAYTTLASAKNGVASVKTNGVDTKKYKVLTASNGEFYFNLVAGNGEIIGTSETYVSKSNVDRAITTVHDLIVQNLKIEAAQTGGAKFEVFTGADKQTYFHLRAANGEIVLASEGYTDKAGALNGIESVRTNGGAVAGYTIFDSTNGQAFFHLTAPNHEIIGTSEVYASKSNATKAVQNISALIASQKIADPK